VREEAEIRGEEKMEVKNPYPEYILDEASGVEVAGDLHRAWDEGFIAGMKVTVDALKRAIEGAFLEIARTQILVQIPHSGEGES